jgi:hypothetical protein
MRVLFLIALLLPSIAYADTESMGKLLEYNFAVNGTAAQSVVFVQPSRFIRISYDTPNAAASDVYYTLSTADTTPTTPTFGVNSGVSTCTLKISETAEYEGSFSGFNCRLPYGATGTVSIRLHCGY